MSNQRYGDLYGKFVCIEEMTPSTTKSTRRDDEFDTTLTFKNNMSSDPISSGTSSGSGGDMRKRTIQISVSNGESSDDDDNYVGLRSLGNRRNNSSNNHVNGCSKFCWILTPIKYILCCVCYQCIGDGSRGVIIPCFECMIDIPIIGTLGAAFWLSVLHCIGVSPSGRSNNSNTIGSLSSSIHSNSSSSNTADASGDNTTAAEDDVLQKRSLFGRIADSCEARLGTGCFDMIKSDAKWLVSEIINSMVILCIVATIFVIIILSIVAVIIAIQGCSLYDTVTTPTIGNVTTTTTTATTNVTHVIPKYLENCPVFNTNMTTYHQEIDSAEFILARLFSTRCPRASCLFSRSNVYSIFMVPLTVIIVFILLINTANCCMKGQRCRRTEVSQDVV